jgi:DNA-binding NtrC family response regulator
VVSATNKNIDQMIADDRFRKDLYFRLGVIKVQVPSLNERPEDIVPLAKHFLHEFSKKFGKKITNISAEAEKALMAHEWTGNVRELKNLMERAVLISKGPELTREALGFEGKDQHKEKIPGKIESDFPPLLSPEGIDLDNQLQSFEKYYIEEAFKMTGGNESKAAKLLNMNHHTFRYRRKKLQSE